MTIGENVVIGDYAHIAGHYSVTIGDNVLMASRVYISDTSHGAYGNMQETQDTPCSAPNKRKLICKPVFVGDNVWIGENVCILPGVRVGHGCIIGANSVVTKDIPDKCIAVGNPCRVVKKWNGSEWKKI